MLLHCKPRTRDYEQTVSERSMAYQSSLSWTGFTTLDPVLALTSRSGGIRRLLDNSEGHLFLGNQKISGQLAAHLILSERENCRTARKVSKGGKMWGPTVSS